MLREAAFMGVPAYSIFRSRMGAVDRYLASIDRLSIVASPADFSNVRLRKNRSISPPRERSDVADKVTKLILDRSQSEGRSDGSGRPRSTT